MAWYDVTGTIADWVMTGAALYASLNAKQWFSQRSHTKGFDKAEDIISRIDSLYLRTNESITNLQSTLEYLNAVSERLTHPDEKYLSRYETFRDIHNVFVKEINTLTDDIALIERWSIKLKNKLIFTEVLKSLFNANSSASRAFGSSRACVYNICSMGKDEFELSLKYYKSEYEEFLRDLVIVERDYQVFKATKFTALFKVE